jgi:hypothetical protein
VSSSSYEGGKQISVKGIDGGNCLIVEREHLGEIERVEGA